MPHSYSNDQTVDSWPEMTFIDLKGKIDMEKIENMLRLAFNNKIAIVISKQLLVATPFTWSGLAWSWKPFQSDEFENNKIGLDADQILDQLNLVTFEHSNSISESLILYLRQCIYHFEQFIQIDRFYIRHKKTSKSSLGGKLEKSVAKKGK